MLRLLAKHPCQTRPADKGQLEECTTGIEGVSEPVVGGDMEPGFWVRKQDGGMEVVHSMAGLSGGDIDILCDLPFGESGYYSVCFMPYPYDTSDSVDVMVTYWIE